MSATVDKPSNLAFVSLENIQENDGPGNRIRILRKHTQVISERLTLSGNDYAAKF